MNPKINSLLMLVPIFWLLGISIVFGLSTDRQKPMSIKSQRVYIDDKSGLSVYEGGVVVIQGSMKITAEKLTIVYGNNQRLKKIIAIGKPSTYKQRPDKKDQDIHAKANKMVYFALKDILVMTTNATIERGGGKINSTTIYYYLNEDRVDTGNEKARVNIILDNKKK